MPPTIAFGEIEIAYDERVLRPRPWTLAQSEWAAELAAQAPPGPALEVCTGAGHIGLGFARKVTRDVVLVDADATACEFARANAVAAGVSDRVEVRHGPMAEAVGAGERFAVILADPPYIPTSDVTAFPEDPVLAIDGGADGMELVRGCVELISAHLLPGGAGVIQLRDAQQARWLKSHVGEHDGLGLVVHGVRALDQGALVHLGPARS